MFQEILRVIGQVHTIAVKPIIYYFGSKYIVCVKIFRGFERALSSNGSGKGK